MNNQYQIEQQKTVFNGYFQIVKYWLKTSLFRGDWSESFTREVFERGHAIGVVPYDKKNNKLLLVEQFRPGAITTPFDPWVIEPIAGIIEAGEKLEDVVRREAMEEAGIKLDKVQQIYHYLVSPGGTSETLALYVAPCDLSNYQNHQVYGLQHEQEDIKVHLFSLQQAVAQVEQGKINNAMSIIAINWLEKHWQQLA